MSADTNPEIVRLLRNMPQVTVAAVRGWCAAVPSAKRGRIRSESENSGGTTSTAGSQKARLLRIADAMPATMSRASATKPMSSASDGSIDDRPSRRTESTAVVEPAQLVDLLVEDRIEHLEVPAVRAEIQLRLARARRAIGDERGASEATLYRARFWSARLRR